MQQVTQTHLPTNLDGNPFRIAVVQARFNSEITDKLAQACIAELKKLGVDNDYIVHLKVPGALEIPVTLQALAIEEHFDALIAVGCVIRGETFHFELVARESAAGVMRVSLDYEIAIANAILTVENEAQAWARVEEKGQDAARVAIELATVLSTMLNVDDVL
jgi:6,7-dimethyl-8-ribityllumazine synthase